MNSLIIPVYKNEASIPALIDALDGLHEALGGDFEAVFVVNGSPDGSASLLQQSSSSPLLRTLRDHCPT